MAGKKTTKRCASCSKPAKVEATRAEYNKLLRKIRRGNAGTREAERNTYVLCVGYNPPHSNEYPSYGQPCWQQAMAEMIAWLALAVALDKYLAAERTLVNGGYMPIPVYQQIVAAYTAAMTEYNAAWFALETCLHGTVV